MYCNINLWYLPLVQNNKKSEIYNQYSKTKVFIIIVISKIIIIIIIIILVIVIIIIIIILYKLNSVRF